jgi:hypothetical protein
VDGILGNLKMGSFAVDASEITSPLSVLESAENTVGNAAAGVVEKVKEAVSGVAEKLIGAGEAAATPATLQ